MSSLHGTWKESTKMRRAGRAGHGGGRRERRGREERHEEQREAQAGGNRGCHPGCRAPLSPARSRLNPRAVPSEKHVQPASPPEIAETASRRSRSDRASRIARAPPEMSGARRRERARRDVATSRPERLQKSIRYPNFRKRDTRRSTEIRRDPDARD